MKDYQIKESNRMKQNQKMMKEKEKQNWMNETERKALSFNENGIKDEE